MSTNSVYKGAEKRNSNCTCTVRELAARATQNLGINLSFSALEGNDCEQLCMPCCFVHIAHQGSRQQCFGMFTSLSNPDPSRLLFS